MTVSSAKLVARLSALLVPCRGSGDFGRAQNQVREPPMPRCCSASVCHMAPSLARLPPPPTSYSRCADWPEVTERGLPSKVRRDRGFGRRHASAGPCRHFFRFKVLVSKVKWAV